MYPLQVRHWIANRGGLTPRMIFLRGKRLASMYHPCYLDAQVAAPRCTLMSSKAFTIIDVPLRRYPNVGQDALELLSSGSSGRYARLEDIRAKRRYDCLGDRRGACYGP